jgi:type IV pilus assembly protein PilF
MANISYEQADYDQARSYMERYQAASQWTPQALLVAIKIANKLDDQDAVASHILLLRSRFPDSDETLEVKKGNY